LYFCDGVGPSGAGADLNWPVLYNVDSVGMSARGKSFERLLAIMKEERLESERKFKGTRLGAAIPEMF
jgi:hypothetical protein